MQPTPSSVQQSALFISSRVPKIVAYTFIFYISSLFHEQFFIISNTPTLNKQSVWIFLKNNRCQICENQKNLHILKIIGTYLYFWSFPDSFPAAIKSRRMYYFKNQLQQKSQTYRYKRNLVQFILPQDKVIYFFPFFFLSPQ